MSDLLSLWLSGKSFQNWLTDHELPPAPKLRTPLDRMWNCQKRFPDFARHNLHDVPSPYLERAFIYEFLCSVTIETSRDCYHTRIRYFGENLYLGFLPRLLKFDSRANSLIPFEMRTTLLSQQCHLTTWSQVTQAFLHPKSPLSSHSPL